MGPPSDGDTSSILNGARPWPAEVGDQSSAASSSCRKRYTADPCNWLEPDRLVRATTAPGNRLTSGAAFEVCTRNSSTASSGISESRLPKALMAGNPPPEACAGRPPADTPVLALIPSTVK